MATFHSDKFLYGKHSFEILCFEPCAFNSVLYQPHGFIQHALALRKGPSVDHPGLPVVVIIVVVKISLNFWRSWYGYIGQASS